MEQQTDLTQQTYTIGSTTYRLEPQSWRQAKWLGESIFKDRDIQTIDYAAIHDCGREQAPLFMAIALLAEGQTRAEQSSRTWPEIQALAREMEPHLTGWEVARFCTHFFYLCRPDQMVMLMPGRMMQDALIKAASSAAPGDSGLSAVSSSSQTGTSPSLTLSAVNSDPLIQIRSSSEDSKNVLLTTPS